MAEPKVGDLVAIHSRAEFHDRQEATGALAPKIYEVLEIDEGAVVLLPTETKDIGKEVSDHSRGAGRRSTSENPVIALRTVFELVILSQDIIGACYPGKVIARQRSSPSGG